MLLSWAWSVNISMAQRKRDRGKISKVGGGKSFEKHSWL